MSDPLVALQELGQSPWLDFITRDLLRSGKLAAMVRAGHVTGLTSNPTIFEQAIAATTHYDDALATLVRAGKSVAAIVDTLMIDDFHLMMIVTLCAIPMLLLLRKGRKAGGGPAHAAAD